MSGARGCRTTRGLRHGSGHGSGPAFLSPKRNSPPPFFFSSKLVCLLSLTLQNCFNLFTPGSLEAFIPAGRSGGFLRRSEGPDARSPGSRHQRHARLAAQLANDHGVCRSAQSRQQLHVTSRPPGIRGQGRAPPQSAAGSGETRRTPPQRPLGAKRGAFPHGPDCLSPPHGLRGGPRSALRQPTHERPSQPTAVGPFTRRGPESRFGS